MISKEYTRTTHTKKT